eukprot:1159696-Pelagomonas_calceolata.AAC.9
MSKKSLPTVHRRSVPSPSHLTCEPNSSQCACFPPVSDPYKCLYAHSPLTTQRPTPAYAHTVQPYKISGETVI